MNYKCEGFCGRVISKEEFEEECDSGSGGFCYCEYSSDDRVLNNMVETEEPLKKGGEHE